MSTTPVSYEIEAAKLASERAAAVLHFKIGRGRASLAAIASTAPFVGILASLYGISEKPCAFGGPAEAIMPTALGLLVALVAMWSRSYLCRNLELLDTEMHAALLELANSLSRQRLRQIGD